MKIIADGRLISNIDTQTQIIASKPNPPRLKNFNIISDSASLFWTNRRNVGPDGHWYGTSSQHVRKSIDEGLIWDVLHDFGVGYVSSNIIPLDNGELLVTFYQPSEVWVSSVGQTVWTKVIDLTLGCFIDAGYGWDVYNNYVLLSEYKTYDPVDTARKIYFSKDFGNTFSVIWDRAVGDVKHQHAVAFDPWANRIWQTYGDPPNTNIGYSDDWGVTWKLVYPVEGVAQCTSIIPRRNCVLFGSDEEPEGVYKWIRNPSEPQSIVRPEDVKRVFKFGNYLDPLALGHVALKAREIDGVLYIPFISYNAGGYSRIVATKDDEHFYEVWRSDDRTPPGVASVLGVDGGGKLTGLYINSGTEFWAWKADPLTWD